jgi:glutamate-1-semialdehyde 2,1-aminomutase
MPTLQETHNQIEATYRKRTPKSAALAAQAQQALPGGDTRTSTTFFPYPSYVAQGRGARLWDVDGNELIDCLNNYTSLIHGNAFPPVVEAARKQIELGTAFGAPNEHQVKLAALIVERVPSVDLVRFTNSGTEATMQAIRAARAFTGRDLIIKVVGGYHGTHESVSIGPGITKGAQAATVQVPYNDIAALEAIVAERGREIAAFIVEPVMGSVGFIPAEREYLRAARTLMQAHGILLILDEVMTFRLDYGGTQTIYGVSPDLTSFAKIIGGGFAVGAFGGRADIMEMYNPANARINHAGTFNGNPVTTAAGLAAMEHLTPEKIAHANALGAALRQGLAEVLDEQGVKGQVTGLGSFVGVHLTDHPVRSAQDAASVRPLLRQSLHLGMVNRGIHASASNIFNISTVMTRDDVDAVIAAFQDTLLELKPALENECTELLR